jgi:hypothetical protein
MVLTAYGHLTNEAARILISHYTTMLIYMDELCNNNIGFIKVFNEKFQRNELQDHIILEAFAEILQEFPQHFGDASMIMLTSSLNFTTSLLLENELLRLPVSSPLG